jgi:hypothetical protein
MHSRVLRRSAERAVPAPTAPRASVPLASRLGLRTQCPRGHLTNAARGPVAPQTRAPSSLALVEARLGWHSREGDTDPRDADPAGDQGAGCEGHGSRDRARTHLSPVRSVLGPVSSAASPAPPHPPQQEVTSSAAFVTSILTEREGEEAAPSRRLQTLSRRTQPRLLFFSPFRRRQLPPALRPCAHLPPNVPRLRPVRRVRHAAGARYARSRRLARPGLAAWSWSAVVSGVMRSGAGLCGRALRRAYLPREGTSQTPQKGPGSG